MIELVATIAKGELPGPLLLWVELEMQPGLPCVLPA